MTKKNFKDILSARDLVSARALLDKASAAQDYAEMIIADMLIDGILALQKQEEK